MTRPTTIFLTLLLVLFIQAQHHRHQQHSRYAPFANREIKALSESEIDGYLNGAGMGLALAAELNRYPGPLHVLDLAIALKLSDEQRKQAQKFYDAMHEPAVALGTQIVEKERMLDSLFVSDRISPEALEKIIMTIASMKGQLRLTHLKAHLQMKAILTETQIKQYNQMRGYAG